jgi:UDP-GlcNAc:undecaprenyl-phosphate GlcNAc-1-phosphate transferase
MMTLLILFGSSLGLCLILTPLVRALAARYGLVDCPDGRRKTHSQPTPVAGGLAILIAGTLAVAAALIVPGDLHDKLWAPAQTLWWLAGLLLAVLVISGLGLVDDCGYLRGRHKLAGQLLAAGILIAFGFVVEKIHIFSWDIELGLLAIPFTLFLLLGAINSLNLLDGMDGLLSTIGLIISLGMAAMAVLGERWPPAAVAVALAGALAGFLVYNFPPASVFLGDTGSMLIGLVVGALAIKSSLKGPATIALAAPVALLAIPILDTTAAILRRKLTGRSIYSTDRGHLHHVLLARGLSIRGVLLWVGLFCLLTAVGALASLAFNNELIALVTAGTVVGILVGMRLFGHAELMLAKQRLSAQVAGFWQGPPKGDARAVEVRLQGSADWNELFAPFLECAPRLNLKRMDLDVNAPAIHEGYHARWDRHGDEVEDSGLWFAEMPLMVRGQPVGRLEITGQRDDEPLWKKIAALMKLVEKVEGAMTILVLNAQNGQAVEPTLSRVRVNGALGNEGPVTDVRLHNGWPADTEARS